MNEISGLASQLTASGIFDSSYYSAVAQLADGLSKNEIAEHYVTQGLVSGLSPHPLIELDYMPPEVRKASQQPLGLTSLLKYLDSPAAEARPWGPLFDPRQIRGGENPIDYLTALRPADTLPVADDFPGSHPTLEGARSALLKFAADHHEQFSAALPPRRKNWDRQATRDWVADISSAMPSSAPDLVSVIMPVYNRAHSVGDAIDSVLGQTHRNLELIVVDDGSTDETPTIVQARADADSRVKLVAGDHIGVGAARNVGLAAARGGFIAFLDSDNTWTRRFLELSLKALATEPASVATHAALRLHGDGGQIEYRGGDAQFADLQIGNSIDMNVLVVRAAALAEVGHFDTTLRRWVDYDLVLRLAASGRLEYLPFIGCDYDNKTADGRITQKETQHWQWVVRERNLVDWRTQENQVGQRFPGRVSVVVVIAGSSGHTAHSIDRLLATFGGDVEVVIVDNGSRASIGRKLTAHYVSSQNVRYLRLPTNNNFATAANYGFAHTTGTSVVFLDSDADPRDGWLDALVKKKEASGACGVQGLLLNADYTIQHAGYSFFADVRLPSPLLAGLPVADAARADLDNLNAISASTVLLDSNVFATVHGFDPLFANGLEDIDLCLRIIKAIEGASFACTHEAIVLHDQKPAPGRHRRAEENVRLLTERWSDVVLRDDRHRYEGVGLQVNHLKPVYSSTGPAVEALLTRTPSLQRVGARGSVRSLRWAIKTGVPSTRGGDHWGDIPFASDLATALRSLGQDVVTDRFDAWNRSTAYLDDVVLTLRGRHAIPPQPGAFNILWVISRPDLVTPEEVRQYDAVLAASSKWAMWMSERADIEIEVLLQATSPTRFRQDLPSVAEPDDLIFVGGSHGHEYGRAIVGLALQAQAPVGLWGPGWSRYAPDHAVREQYLPSEFVPAAYKSANIVLNDHFEDMARWGFVNNRAFDAIACGTPVISDAIDGLEIFEGAAVIADSVERMRELVTDRSWIPTAASMQRIAEMVRNDHSFEARANRLLDIALEGKLSR